MNAGMLTLLAQARGSGEGGVGGAVIAIVELGIVVLLLVSMWQVFVKAGQPGWGILIPIYNLYLMLKIAGRPGWWLILAFIPLVNLVLLIIPFDIAQNFRKGVGFGLGLLLLGFVFYPILAFSNARYEPVAH